MLLFISAFGLGLIFNAAPGAVFAATVREGVRGGFRQALDVQIGSLVGDAIWAVLGLVGVGLLLRAEVLRLPVGIAGALYLLWLAFDSWRAASGEFSLDASTSSSPRKALREGVLLSITNPQNIAYWAALGSALGAVGIHEPTASDYGVFFAGFMVSSFLWAFVCAALVDRLFRNASARWAKLTYKLCAIAFLVLAASAVRDLIAQAAKKREAASAVLMREQ
jgi:chemosensory pili system protein ChpE/L-lysine exporter family protein LysE/ArgO